MTEPVDVQPIRPFTREQPLEAWRANPRPNASACARAWGVPRTTARRWLAQWQNHDAPANAATRADMVMTSGRKIGRILAALVIGLVGLGLAGIGMAATITYSIETTGTLTAALAAAADTMALLMPAAACALWCTRRWLLAIAAWALWAGAVSVAALNVAGFIGQHTDSFLGGREVQSIERALVLERLGRLRAERTETRPAAAITVAIRNAGRVEIENRREALVMAKRWDEIERDLAILERRLTTLPAVTMADPSAGILAACAVLRQQRGRHERVST
jgi:hypothetical protein